MAISFKVPSRAKPPAPYDFPQGYAGGLNTAVAPDMIKENQSPDLCNVNFDDGGIITKRLGVQRANAISWGATGIKGLYEFWKVGATAPILLCSHGGKVYSYNDATDTLTDLCTGAKVSVTDDLMQWFAFGSPLAAYGYNGTDFISYDGTNPVADAVGYIPLVITDKNPDGTGGASNEQLNLISDSWQEQFAGTVGDTAYVLVDVATSVICWINGVLVDAADYTFTTGTATVTFDTAPGTNTVLIQGTKTGLGVPTDITDCTIFQVYGGQTDTRVFATGNPNKPNTRWQSGLNDPTYWPNDKDEFVGSSGEAVTGLGHLIDYQIIGKERSFQYSYVKEEVINSVSVITYPTLPFNDEYGCLAGRTMAPAAGGLLALCCDHEGNPAGVGWIYPSAVRSQTNIKIISIQVNRSRAPLKGICDYSLEDLKAAHAILHDTKYYLFIKDRTFILDLQYSDLANNVSCWYPYDTAFSNVGCFLSRYTGGLWLGDKDAGLVYKPQEIETATTYQDDATAFDSYWQAPLLFCGQRDWIKKFLFLRLGFAGQAEGNHILTFITDTGEDPITLIFQEDMTVDLNNIDFDNWSFGVNFFPYPQSEKVGIKSVYFSWRISNSQPSEKMTVNSQSLQYQYDKLVK